MLDMMWPYAKSRFINMLVMKRVGNMTLRNYYSKFKPNKTTNNYIHNYVRWLAQQLQLSGIEHMNLHSGNIMVSVDSNGKITNMWIIDYGLSKHYPVGKVVPHWNLLPRLHESALERNFEKLPARKLAKIIANERKQHNKKSLPRTRSARSSNKKSLPRTRSAHI